MNVYTSVYNYGEFSSNRGLEHSVIIDRIFLDIDAHGNDSLEEAYQNLKDLHGWLVKRNLKHRMAFSGRGFISSYMVIEPLTLEELRLSLIYVMML